MRTRNRCNRRRGILGIVRAAQRRDADKARDLDLGATGHSQKRAVAYGHAIHDRVPRRNADNPPRPLLDMVGDQPGGTGIDPHHGYTRRIDEPALDVAVTLESAMPVDMVGTDIEEDADRRVEARRQLDLIG